MRVVGHDIWLLWTRNPHTQGCGSPVVKVSDHGRHVMSSSPVPLKTRRVGQRCRLNLSRAETSLRWCGVAVRKGAANSGKLIKTERESHTGCGHWSSVPKVTGSSSAQLDGFS
ncbi:uncharacterized protein TNCV_4979531 [Trichonephila clavipes]|nr:uncharacterized protein TNCV_4979531 [Trichonephila clavipes]